MPRAAALALGCLLLAAPSAPAATLHWHAVDYVLTAPPAPAGGFTPHAYTFDLVNGGISPHQLAVSGPGLPAGGMLWDVSFPGETSAAKTVTLRAGRYHFFCNIHPTLMHVDVVVHATGDGVAPRLTLTRPRCPKGVTGRLCTAFRHSPRAWRTLRGTVADPGGTKASGVRSVLVTVVRKRRADCLVFVRGAFRARTCKAAAAVRVRARLLTGGRYTLGLRGIAAGRYAITIRAVDRAGNVATLRRAVVVRAATT
jgi:hypothetical protein